jgi:hypothetical protein
MNLGPPASSPGSRRPYQAGHASGTKAGKPVRVAVEWLVDTGADIGVVRNGVGANFDLVATAASASPTTGGGGILVKRGLRVEFAAEDSAGASHAMASSLPVGVKSTNTGSDILGMDQLASVGVEVTWKPDVRTGALLIPPVGPPAPAPAPGPTTKTAPPPGITDHGTWLDIGGVRLEKRLWRRS